MKVGMIALWWILTGIAVIVATVAGVNVIVDMGEEATEPWSFDTAAVIVSIVGGIWGLFFIAKKGLYDLTQKRRG